MTINHRTKVRSLALLAGIVAFALIAVACSHAYLHFIDHDAAADSNHHCLLCTVLSSTILSNHLADLQPALHSTNLPFILLPVSIELPSVLSSIAARAPPRFSWN